MFKNRMFKTFIIFCFLIFAREIYADNTILSTDDFEKQVKQIDQQNDTTFQNNLKQQLSQIPPPPGPRMEIPATPSILHPGEQGNPPTSNPIQPPVVPYTGFTPQPAAPAPQPNSNGWTIQY